MCGYTIEVPLKKTGDGKYTIHYSASGYIGYTKEVVLEEDDCKGNNCPLYTLLTPTLEDDQTRVMLSWDGSVEGLDFSVYRVNSTATTSTKGLLLSSGTDGSDYTTVKNIANVLDGTAGGTTYTIRDSNYMSYILYASLPEKMAEVHSVPTSADGLLKFAGWRNVDELASMTTEDKRNTLIVEYNKVSSMSISILQSVSTSQLVDASTVAVFLMKWNLKTVEQLKELDYTDQKNALINGIIAKGVSIYSLEGLSGAELVDVALDLFDDEYIKYDSISMVITNGVTTETATIPEVPEGSKYWVIGCLEASNSKFTFVTANLFIDEDPLKENSRFCYNVFEDAKKEEFSSNAFIESVIYSAYDNTPVMSAVVQAGLSLSTDVTNGVTDGQGIAYVPVYANGEHEVIINGEGFENNWATVNVDCEDAASSCMTRLQLYVAPDLSTGEAMITLGWGNQVDDMNLKVYYVNAYSSDEYTMADKNHQSALSNAQYIVNTAEYTENVDGLANANSVLLSGLDSQDSVSYMVTAYNSYTSEMQKSSSMVTFTDHDSTNKISINKKYEFEQSLRGVLLFGEWQSVSEIFNADSEEQRNTLIVELSSWSTNSVSTLQAMTDEELINHGSITAFLKVFSEQFSSQEMLKELSFDDQMGAFLYEIAMNEGVLNWFRTVQGDWYLTSGDLVEFYSYCEDCTKFELVFQMAPKFSRTPTSKENWVAGCISVTYDTIQWIPVGEFITTIDPFFCHNLIYSSFVATEAPEPEFYDGVGLDIIARNSQDNSKLSNAYISVTYQGSSGLTVVADDVAMNSDGTAFIGVDRNGYYSVQIRADGFIDADFEMEVQCTSADCENKKLISMSPTLDAGQTRIMLTWEKENPSDLDIHIVSVKKSDHSTCRTYYGNKSGCTKISLDLDNTSGGLNGAETMTLQDNALNKDYVYVIAVEDYNFESSGNYFLDAGAQVTITNGVKTVYKRMEAYEISYSTE